MFYWLIELSNTVPAFAFLRGLLNVFRYITFRTGGAMVTGALFVFLFGPWIIDHLRLRQGKGQPIRADGPKSHFSKADLMNAYINEIFLGQDGDRAIHGFGLASQFYFGKPLSELELSEVALLVSIVRGPSYYDPRRHPDRVKVRRDLVLKLMAARNIIKAADAQAATRKPLGVTPKASGTYYPAYLDFVRRTLRRDYRNEDLTGEGLRIYTSLEPRAQDQAEHALERELERLDHAHKYPDSKLEGAVGPALCGPAFIERSVQEGRSVDDLFFIVRTFMPYGKPGSLSKQQYVDVLAFVLKANGYRVGNKALPLDSAVLSRILISSANQ